MDKEELECMNKTLKLLEETRKKFDEIWEQAGLDLACFDVNINLSIKVNEVKMQIMDSWKNILSK